VKASRRVSGHGLLKCLHFKRSEPESRVAIPSRGELTTSFSDSIPCESPAGEIVLVFLGSKGIGALRSLCDNLVSGHLSLVEKNELWTLN